jgi:hypothetical protein
MEMASMPILHPNPQRTKNNLASAFAFAMPRVDDCFAFPFSMEAKKIKNVLVKL